MNVLITGASKGIGAELVKQFAAESNNNIIAISRASDKLNQLSQYCEKQYENKIHIYSIDFLSGNFQSNIEEVLEKHKYFNVVINNAGYLLNKPLTKYTTEEIENIFKINTYAPVYICQQIMSLNQNQPCHVINIGSMGGYQGSSKFPGLSIYSSSKAALANLTECLAEEYKDTSIKFNCLALGSVQTEMLENAFPNYKGQVTALEMAEYIYQFAINGHKYYNGKVIPVSKSTP